MSEDPNNPELKEVEAALRHLHPVPPGWIGTG